MRIVAALAGRRTDAIDAVTARFPEAQTGAVRNAIAELLRREGVDTLVCSAACGADLLALDAAMSLGLRCRIVLPFSREEFRRTSVIDRPGEWGDVYDRVLTAAGAKGELIVLSGEVGESRSYSQATETILREAREVARDGRCIAILVWDGNSYGEADLTAEFGRLAAASGIEQREVLTKAT